MLPRRRSCRRIHCRCANYVIAMLKISSVKTNATSCLRNKCMRAVHAFLRQIRTLAARRFWFMHTKQFWFQQNHPFLVLLWRFFSGNLTHTHNFKHVPQGDVKNCYIFPSDLSTTISAKYRLNHVITSSKKFIFFGPKFHIDAKREDEFSNESFEIKEPLNTLLERASLRLRILENAT